MKVFFSSEMEDCGTFIIGGPFLLAWRDDVGPPNAKRWDSADGLSIFFPSGPCFDWARG